MIQVLFILWLSTAILAFLWRYGCYAVVSGSRGYETWAEALAGFGSVKGNTALAWRDVGYPLELLLGAWPWSHSFSGVTQINAAMALMMPFMVMITLRPWYPVAAFWAGLASVLSLAPFVMFKSIHHDQAYMFFMLWTVAAATRTRPYATAILGFIAGLFRLVGQGLTLPLLVLTAFTGRRSSAVVAGLLFMVFCLDYSIWRDHALGFPQSIIGRQIFVNPYLHMEKAGVRITPDLGPAAAALVEYVHVHDGDRYLAQPSWEGYYFFVDKLEVPDRVLRGVALELMWAHPGYIVRYVVGNSFKLLFDPGWNGNEGNPFPMSEAYGRFGVNSDDEAPEPAASEARETPLKDAPAWARSLFGMVETGWSVGFGPVSRGLFVLDCVAWLEMGLGLAAFVMGLRPWQPGPALLAGSAATVALAANVLITAALVNPLYRFAISIMLLKIILAAIGVATLAGVYRAFRRA